MLKLMIHFKLSQHEVNRKGVLFNTASASEKAKRLKEF